MTPSQSGELAERHWVFYAAELCRPFVDKVPVGIGLSWGKEHLTYMLGEIAQEKMSATKACRWLGWIQACVVFSGVTTLEGMKELNKVASTSSALDLSPFAVPQAQANPGDGSDASSQAGRKSAGTAPSPVGLVEEPKRENYWLEESYSHDLRDYARIVRPAAEQLRESLAATDAWMRYWRGKTEIAEQRVGEAHLKFTAEFMRAERSHERNKQLQSDLETKRVECDMLYESAGLMKRGLDAAREALGRSACPRPANDQPDDLRVSDCVASGHCGCDNAIALAHREPAGGEGL